MGLLDCIVFLFAIVDAFGNLPLFIDLTSVMDRRTRQQGIIQWYLIYICLALMVLLLSLMPWGQMWNWMLVRG